MKKKVFAFSADALVGEDIAYLATRPNFSRIMKDAARAEHVQSVYPSITYPAHAAMITGCYPDKNGIEKNGFLTMQNAASTDWLLEFSEFKCEDLFAAAKRAGCTTANVYWPIMGNNPNIDYNINEYFFPDPAEGVLEGFAKFGANEATLDVIRENLPLFTRREPEGELTNRENSYEYFINGCVCSLIRRYQPDLLAVHNCVMDNTRHCFGIFSEYRKPALDLLDEWLGEIVQAMEDAGVYEDTNFVLISDHGQMDYDRCIYLNKLMLDAGWFTTNEDNSAIADYQAFSYANGMSTYVYLKDPADKDLYARVENFLQEAYMSGKYGIERVYDKAEVKARYHLDGPFSFIIEAKAGCSFRDRWVVDSVVSDPFPTKGNHGYLPEKGPWPVFIAAGPAFRPGATVPVAHLVNMAPTMAAALGIALPQADGEPLTALLR